MHWIDREFNAVREITPSNEQDAIDSLNLVVQPLAMTRGRAIGPDAEALKDLLYVGRTTQHPRWWPSPTGEIDVLGLEEHNPRRVFVFHRQQKLAGSLVLKRDAADGFETKLQPWATARGRLVDEDGEPLAARERFATPTAVVVDRRRPGRGIGRRRRRVVAAPRRDQRCPEDAPPPPDPAHDPTVDGGPAGGRAGSAPAGRHQLQRAPVVLG